LTGYLHWGWNYWTDDPYQEVGMHIGDGWHVYPVKDGVLNSLRWEQMRNGIQDYEYFRMLEDEVKILKDSLGSAFSWIDPTQRGREIAGRVVMGLDQHNDDPAVLYQAKRDVIQELMDFRSSPRIYVQTKPEDNSLQKADEYLTEVYGWTEPGNRIVLNGKDIPVNNRGLFLVNISLDAGNGLVVIEATNAKGVKKVVRNFDVR
jgi:hypothetical protein